MFGTIGAIGLLGVSSYFDVRWKRIPLAALAAGGIWALVWTVINMVGQGVFQTLLASLPALLPGGGLLILSRLTEKKVGSGDGILLLLLGLLLGAGEVLLLFCVGLFLQSLVAVVLVLIKKADKQTCIPFVPFLLAAWMLVKIV